MQISPYVLILAAGRGKRMVSSLPKVLHPVLFRPMIHYVLDVAKSLPHQSVYMVVGHGENAVRESCTDYPDVQFLLQKEQLGTGHAVRMVEPSLAGKQGHLLILSGDVILLRPGSLERVIREHVESNAACTLTTARLPNPRGYGRILRRPDGGVAAIREEVDCDDSQRMIDEVNAGIYCFELGSLFSALSRISDRNLQKEFYLTDAIGNLVAEGKKVSAVLLDDPLEMAGINDRKALWQVETILQNRVNEDWMMKGVTLRDPHGTFIDPLSRLEPDTLVEGGCQIIRSTVGRGSILEQGCRLVESHVAGGSHIKQGSYLERSRVGEECTVGPYAHLRPGSVLEKRVKIGNFVETKSARLGEGSKASHLSYIGDAEIGRNVNLGCGFITCNYDGGPVKHKTIIEDDVFIGSDSQMVAPVRIGAGSYVASGSTITADVPAGALAISRGKQTNKAGYAGRIRDRKTVK